MRIAMVGGASSYHVHKWATTLDRLGHDVVLFNTKQPGASIDGIEIVETGLEPLPPRRIERYLRYLQVSRRLGRQLRSGGFDAVNVQWVDATPIALAFRGVPGLVVTPWGRDIIPDRPRSRLRNWFVRDLLNRAGAITTSSETLDRSIRPYMRKPVPFFRVYFGIDLTRYIPVEGVRAESGIRFGIAKPLAPKYGQRTLIEAFALVVSAHPGASLRIAGDGPDLEPLRELCSRLGVASNVTFLGRLRPEAMPDFYGSIDVFVMPSVNKSEVFGVAAIEASAMGLPVVATTVGGIPEAVRHGETGILVSPGNMKELAAAMEGLITDPDLRSRLGIQGRRFVEEHFDLFRVNAPAFVEALQAARRSRTGRQRDLVPVESGRP